MMFDLFIYQIMVFILLFYFELINIMDYSLQNFFDFY